MRLMTASSRVAPNVVALLLLVQHGVARRAAVGGQSRRTKMLDAMLNNPAQYEDKTEPGAGDDCHEIYGKPMTAEKANVWRSLSSEETAAVVEWLFEQDELNLTMYAESGEWDNTIAILDVMSPNKTDVLGYLYESQPEPARFARATLDNRATETPTYQDILIGPLPVGPSTAWSSLEYPLTRKTGGSVRNLGADTDTLYDEWFYRIGAEISDITMDLCNGSVLGRDTDTIDIWGIDPLMQDPETGRVHRWDGFWMLPESGFDADTVLPLGLYFKSDVTGRDPSKWGVEGWFYDNQFFETTEEFVEAYWDGRVNKRGPVREGEWVGTDRRGPGMPMDEAKPPEPVAPSGSRFSIDYENKYVEWMGFSFYVGFSRDTGVSLYDVRFEGDRVLYELGMQEALAHYAGNDPVQSGTAYLDSFYGFGPYVFELLKGYDCPTYATYLNTSFYVGETTRTHVSSLCLFEFDTGYPIQRHTTDYYVSATKNIELTLRYVAVMGNYDYTFSYTFSLDGTIAVDVRASGYIQAAYAAHNDDYGFRIRDNLSGSMHDHVINFKADFDILGDRNTVQLSEVVPTTETYPWSNGEQRRTMKLRRSVVGSEDDPSARLRWDPNLQTSVLVVNTDEKTTTTTDGGGGGGEARGYRIQPTTPGSHLTIPDSTVLGRAARWAGHDVQVTVRKDGEPRSAHPFNGQDVHDPPVDFDAFFDGEDLVQRDVVLWLNVGMHHVPNTADLPNTVTTGARAGFAFVPSNFGEWDASRRTANMVRVVYEAGEVEDVRTFGAGGHTCINGYSPVEVDLWAYTGDVAVRKFPYDPNNPFYETDSIG